MDDYCLNHTYGYCERVNRNVPEAFCKIACKGNWASWYKANSIPIEIARKANRKIIYDDGQITSVCIPVREYDFQYLDWTIESVRENANGPLEIIVFCDGFNPKYIKSISQLMASDVVKGQRYAMNRMADAANGKYLFRLDGHCMLSPQWDSRLKESCKDKTIVTTIFDSLEEPMFAPKGYDMGFVKIRDDYRTVYLKNWIPISERKTEEETMGFSGCSWMVQKDFYGQIGGSDENMGGWGAIGAEMALKTWQGGGKCLIRTDVVTYHLFRNKVPFEVDQKQRAIAFKILREKFPDISWLREKFKKELNAFDLVKIKEESEQYDAVI